MYPLFSGHHFQTFYQIIFYNVMLCNLVDGYRTVEPHHEERGTMFLEMCGTQLPNYTISHPRKP